MGRKERQIQQRRGLQNQSTLRQFIPVVIAFLLLTIAVVILARVWAEAWGTANPPTRPTTTVSELIEG